MNRRKERNHDSGACTTHAPRAPAYSLLVLAGMAAIAPLRAAVHFADSPDTIVDTRGVGIVAPGWVTASQDTFVEFVEVRWEAVAGATGYRVFRGVHNNPTLAQAIVAQTTATVHEDSTADPATTYYYWVRTLQGAEQSAFSTVALGRRLDPRPPPPANLTATRGTHADFVRLQWGAVGAAQRYEVYRAARDAVELARALSTNVLIAQYEDPAPIGWTLYYWVASANALGTSDWTGPVRGRAGRSVTWWGAEIIELQMPEDFAEAEQVELGRRHGLALLPGGRVGAWGDNAHGQSSVPAGLAGVTAIAAGYEHSLALRRDGTVTGWGRNHRGQAGGGFAARHLTAIAGGGEFSLGLRRDGVVLAWGDNSDGQLALPPAATDVVMIAAGGGHALALRADGTVLAWGRNNRGQADVPAGLAGVEAVAAGMDFSLALLDDGTVRGWGNNDNGQAPAFYDGQRIAPRGAIRPHAGPSNVVSIAAGLYHSVFTLANGTVVTAGLQTAQPPDNAHIAATAAGDDFNTALRRQGAPASVGLRPVNPRGPEGARVIFHTQPLATGQLRYQWYRDGEPLPGATRHFYRVDMIAPQHAGAYTVRVSNDAGEIESEPSVLSIGAATALVDFFPAYRLLDDGWVLASSLGYIHPEHFPLVYHRNLGWVWFADEQDPAAGYYLYLCEGAAGWIWTHPDIFPYYRRLAAPAQWIGP
jgi:fibronectin type 3 domain-containing protein